MSKYLGFKRASEVLKGMAVRTTKPLQNGYIKIPAGAIAYIDVHEPRGGKICIAFSPCGCCGIASRISGLDWADIRRDDQDGAKVMSELNNCCGTTCDKQKLADEINALKAQVEALLEPAKEAAEALGFASHHLRGRASENMLMDMAEKADALTIAIGSTPAQCLAARDAEIKVQAGRDGFVAGALSMDAHGMANIVEHEADEYANQLRQQAKAG